jgi:hypothetical protein
MAKYLVRSGFNLELLTGNSKQYFEGGSEVELTLEQYAKVKHMVEEIPELKPASKEPK